MMGKREVHDIEGGHELRFETPARKDGVRTVTMASDSASTSKINVYTLKVLSGCCEVFGTELPVGQYELLPQKSYALFSYLGCKVEVDESLAAYTSEDTPMREVCNIHENLELMRNQLAGPRVAVVGGSNSGKTSLVKILTSYAVRMNRKPVLVDLDLSKNNICVPGAIAATVVEGESDLYGETAEVASFRSRSPMVCFIGTTNVSDNTNRMKEQVGMLGENIEKRMIADRSIRSAGMIIDTFPWASTTSMHKTLVACLEKLKVDVVLVIGHDRLLSQLKKDLLSKNKNMIIVKVPRSGGVADADSNREKRLLSERMRWYFEGLRQQLSPSRLTVTLGTDIKIYLVRQNVIADASIRPIGMEKMDDDRIPQVNVVDTTLVSAVMAVATTDDEEKVMTSNIAGFVHVVEVDAASNTLTLLLPCPGALPSKALLHGKLKWYETY